MQFYLENGHFSFLMPLYGAFRNNICCFYRLIRKLVVDFVLVIIELFFTKCYG